jgi:hypothetical protein
MVVPKVTADTTPVPEPIVATAVLVLNHVPPLRPFVSVMVEPTQTADGPPIAVGDVYIVTRVVTRQPEPNE